MNDAGYAIGQFETATCVAPCTRGFVWSQATGTVDLTLAGNSGSIVDGVSESGVAIGRTFADSPAVHQAFRWTATTGVQGLGTLGGTTATPTLVGADGRIFGISRTPSELLHAFMWSSGTGMQDISPPWAVGSSVDSVSPDGIVIGAAIDATRSLGFVWTPQTGTAAITLGGPRSRIFLADSNNQFVIGAAQTPDGVEQPVYWTRASGLVQLPTLAPGGGKVGDVNKSGLITGSSATAPGVRHATNWQRTSYTFSGFFQPVDSAPTLNVVKAGAAVPLKFSLGGDFGLGILAAGYPLSTQIACDLSVPQDEVEQTATAGNNGLQYDAASGQYTYVWKTSAAWANTCRQVTIRLDDGSDHVALFRFKK